MTDFLSQSWWQGLAVLGPLVVAFVVWQWKRVVPGKPTPVRIVPDPVLPQTCPQIRLPEHRNVVGRDTERARLATQLQMGRGAVVTSAGAVVQADGGMGKTTLARSYAEHTRNRYNGGCWMSAAQTAAMLDDLIAFGHAAFDLAIPDDPGQRVACAKAVVARAETCGARLLFVFDNVDDFKMVQPFVPEAECIDVIVTTRKTGGFPGYQRLELDEMDHATPDSEAVDLLLQEAGQTMADPATREAAWHLAKELGGLPLGLVIAGALVRRGESFDGVADDIARLVEATPDSSEAYPDSLSAALALSYGKLSGDARWLADVMAWWAPDGLEPRLFIDAPGGDLWDSDKGEIAEAWHGLLADPARVRAAFAELRALSMLRAEAAEGPQRMHRLTATVLRHRQGADAQGHARAAAALLERMYPGGARPAEDPAHWPECRRLTPHGLALWAKAEGLWTRDWCRPGWEPMDTLLNQIGVFLSSQEDRAGSLVAARASHELSTVLYKETDRDFPVALGNLAMTLMSIEEFAEAEGLLDRALSLDLRDRAGGADQAARLLQRASLELRRWEAGGATDKPGDLSAALDWLEQAREIETARSNGAASAELALTWNEIGYLHRLAGRALEMADAVETAHETLRGLPEVDRGLLATYAMNAGVARLEAGQPEVAEGLLREAWEIREDIYAPTPGHSERRKAAGWLATCLLVLDRRQGGTARQDEARGIALAVGLDWGKVVAEAAVVPLEPVAGNDAAG